MCCIITEALKYHWLHAKTKTIYPLNSYTYCKFNTILFAFVTSRNIKLLSAITYVFYTELHSSQVDSGTLQEINRSHSPDMPAPLHTQLHTHTYTRFKGETDKLNVKESKM